MPRLPKNYKNELTDLERQKRAAIQLRDKYFPLRFDMTRIEPIPSASREKFRERILELSDLYGYLAALAKRHYDQINWDLSTVTWEMYAAGHMDEGPGMVAAPQIFKDIASLEDGGVDLMAMQTCQSWWFLKNYEYRFDCTVMLAKLLINLHWARANESVNMISSNLYQFPAVSMALEEGPYYPTKGAMFDKDDEHFVIWEQDQLWLVPFGERELTHRVPMDVIYI